MWRSFLVSQGTRFYMTVMETGEKVNELSVLEQVTLVLARTGSKLQIMLLVVILWQSRQFLQRDAVDL